MNDDRLKDILQTADMSAGLPHVESDLSGRVLRRARRRNVARPASLALGAVIVAGGGSIFWRTRPAAPPPHVAQREFVSRDVLQVQLAAYEKDAQFHARLADAMWRAESEEQSQSPKHMAIYVSPFGARQELDIERELAAQILVNRADRLMRRPDSQAEAAEAYRRVIELFPDSPPAQVARDRLRGIKA